MKEISSAKVFTVFQVILFIVVVMSVVVVVNVHQRNQALVEAQEKTRILLEHNLAIHSYFAKQLKPKVFELSDQYRESSYFEPAWMSSTYAVREIDKYYKILSRRGYFYKESAINARSPENEADAYERAFIDELKRNARLTERSMVRFIDDKPFFVLIRRGESMEHSCLRCHSQPEAAPADLVKNYGALRSFNRTDGELVSAISIRIPLYEAYRAANAFTLKLSLLLVIILGIAFKIQYLVVYRLYLKPLNFIREKVLSILGDETKLGETIVTNSISREVNDLTRSFNELSRNLRNEKDSLVAQVRARTSELTEKVTLLESSLSRIRKLEGIITICGHCKKICDDKRSWHQLESYISQHSEAMFSHGMCPDCLNKEMANLNIGPYRHDAGNMPKPENE